MTTRVHGHPHPLEAHLIDYLQMPNITVNAQEESHPWLELSLLLLLWVNPQHPRRQDEDCLQRLQTKMRQCVSWRQHLCMSEPNPRGDLITDGVPQSCRK